jgi:hypothetical protein
MNKEKHRQIGEIEMPVEYFNLDSTQKKAMCIDVLQMMLKLINQNAGPGFNTAIIMNGILESSIQTNEINENFEICALLKDIQTMFNA